MAETNAEEKQESPAGRKKQLAAGTMVVVCLLAAAFFLWQGSAAKQSPVKAPAAGGGIGVVDVRRAMLGHSRGKELAELRQEQELLELQLQQARRMLLRLMAPKLSTKPFQDAARQKSVQELIRNNGEFLAKLDKLEQERREATRSAYEAERDEINNRFLNDIFNIRLKLDNSKIMKLSEKEIAELEARLKALQQQRGQLQLELYRRREGEIRAWKEALAAQHGIDMRIFQKETEEQRLSEELKKRSEAQQRNLKAMQENMKLRVQQHKRIAELQIAVKEKRREAAALEAVIMQAVSGRVAKLALLHKLDLVLAKPLHEPFRLDSSFGAQQKKQSSYSQLVNAHAVDLTAELLQELGSLTK